MLLFKKPVALFLLTSLIFVSGCFEYEERITLKKDGSGSLEVEYWTLSDLHFDDDSLKLPSDEKDLRKEIEEKYTSDKVKLKDFDSNKEDKSHHVRFKVVFDNLLDLNEIPQFHENKIQFERSGKKFKFCRKIMMKDLNMDEDEGPSNLLEHFIVNLVEEGLSNIKFRFEIETPYDINESNATFTPGDNRAVWKFRLSDVMYQKEVDLTFETR